MVERKAFDRKRNVEYLDKNELISMTGIEPGSWDRVILQELLDNALDHSEIESETPEIDVTFELNDDHCEIAVKDNGPGLDSDLIRRIVDFDLRASTKRDYKSITRGCQGNALKTVVGMPCALADGHQPYPVRIASQSKGYQFKIDLDDLLQEVKLEESSFNPGNKKTSFQIKLPGNWSGKKEIVHDYALFNPHVKFIFNGEVIEPVGELDKQIISDPTVIHHYTYQDFERLMNAEIRHAIKHDEKPKTIRQFISQFYGFKSSKKQKKITDYFKEKRIDGLADDRKELLKKVLQEHSSNPKPESVLGYVGEDQLRGNLPTDLGHYEGYKKLSGYYTPLNSSATITPKIPYILEGILGFWEDDDHDNVIKTAINFRPTYRDPISENCFYNTSNSSTYGDSLRSLLDSCYVDEGSWYDPYGSFFFLWHLICPNLSYKEKGKMSLALPKELQTVIARLVWLLSKRIYRKREKAVNRYYRAQKREEKRKEQKDSNDDGITMKEAVFDVL